MENKKLTTSLVASLLIATNLFANEIPEISTITVTSATKSEQSIQDVTSNIEIITKEEIEEKHYTSVSEILKNISGIDVISNGGLGQVSTVKLRGFDSKRVLVLIDGTRYNDPTSLSGALLENVMVNNIERIEIIKGAQSGIWGADASAGVINIITKTPENGFTGNVNVEYGSFDTKKYGLSLAYKTKKYYIEGLYNKVQTDGFTAYAINGTDIDLYEDDGYTNESYGIKAGLNIDDNNKIDFRHSITKYESEIDNYGSDSSTAKTSGENKFTNISFQNINDFAKTDIYYNKSEFYRNYPAYSTKYDGSIDEIGVKTNIDYLNRTSFLVAEVDYKKSNENDSFINDYKNKGFSLTNSNKFDNLIITESVRFDDFDSFKDKTTGKIGIKYSFTDNFYTSSNYGLAYNTPLLSQLYGLWGANPDLTPETTKSLDFTVGYYDFSATYFKNDITDMIDWQGAGYINLAGTSVLKGFELNYKKEIIADTLFNLSYTRLSAKDNAGNDLVRRAKDNLKFGVDYYGIQNFHININGEYVGERKDSNYSTAQTGKYTVWNSVVNYDINKDTKVYLKLDNIFDKYYQTVDGYATAPRSAYLGVNYKF